MDKCTFPECSPVLSHYEDENGQRMCQDCAALHAAALLEKEDLSKLRRRAEDMLRKNPGALKRVLVSMVVEGDLSLTQGGGQ